MRRPHTDAITQPATHPSTHGLRLTQTERPLRRANRFMAVALGLAFGLGVVLMLAQPSAWLPPSTRVTERDVTAAEPSTGSTLSFGAWEDMGMTPTLFEDIFARL